jgi:hypothetical protein
MIHRNRFKLALERLEHTQWRRFEEFASAFLVNEFPNLRTLATSSGDGGRDGELYTPLGAPETVLQYSVSEGWEAKIRDTVKKIKKNFPDARELIYVTNQEIGAKADEHRKEARKAGLILDVRDQSFFVDRFQRDSQTERLAEELAQEIVDPFLEGRGVVERKAQALTTDESRAALVFLELQWEDDTRDKGLTKTAFDAFVRTALRHTAHPDSVMSRTDVQSAVAALLPGKDQDLLKREVDKALSRLDKQVIKHNTRDDTFCLSFDERMRLKERLAENEFEGIALEQELILVAKSVTEESIHDDQGELKKIASHSRVALERFLLQRGENFVHALQRGQLNLLGLDKIKEVVDSYLRSISADLLLNDMLVKAICDSVRHILQNASPAIRKHLRSISDSYTLFAFLKETPDIQSAVKKMFSHGEIWLDASILLPIFSEDLLGEDFYQFRRLIKACTGAGLKLKVTPGVIEEVERHMHRCLAYASSDRAAWRGSIPYLFAYYVSTGASPAGFQSWISGFIGRERPQDDIGDFLRDDFEIQVVEISEDSDKASPSLRNAVKEHWMSIHEQRRKNAELDLNLTLRLAEHDTENFLGVISRRKSSGESALGYSSWWLTLDNQAFYVAEAVERVLGDKLPSPVMSADFLANYLAFGPLRDQVSRKQPEGLPVALDPSLVAYLTPELIELATKVREEMIGQPERVIRRGVRDALDKARRRQGKIHQAGLTLAD